MIFQEKDNKLFNSVVNHANLLKAFFVARKGKTKNKEVLDFEGDLQRNILDIIKSITRGKYEVGEYKEFKIYDPKERLIQATPFVDRVVQHMICDEYLTPLIDRVCIYDNCACRPNKGTDFAQTRLRSFMQARKQNNKLGYCLQIDIRKYFNSINHNVLKEILRKKVKSEKLCKLLDKFIDSYHIPIEETSEYSSNDFKGLAMGNQTSQIFALLYLDSVDRIAKEKYRIKHYVRYMDDIVIMSDDKETLVNLLQDIKEELGRLKLEVNKDKTKIFKVSTGITFIGFRFKFNNRGLLQQQLKTASRGRIKAKLNKKLSEYKLGLITLEKFSETLQSYLAYLKKERNCRTNLISDEIRELIKSNDLEWDFSMYIPIVAKVEEKKFKYQKIKRIMQVPGIKYEKKTVHCNK